jgi:hypothetical protein
LRKWIGFLSVLALVVLAGCGGGNGGSGSGPSPFGGTWSGTWSDATQSGTLKVTVTEDGGMTGSIVNDTLGLNGTVSGTVQNNGDVTSTYLYPGQVVVQANGNVTLQPNGHWMGSVTEMVGNINRGTANLDLIKQPAQN